MARILSFAHSTDTSNVDLERGAIFNVKEANYGLNKNGYFFTEELLNGLAEQGNAGQGIKCSLGHSIQGVESLGSYIGRKMNFRVENNALYSDLYLDHITKETLINGTTVFSFVTQMAERNPDMLGMSVVFTASVTETEIDGVNHLVPILDTFTASDLVDEPAATNHLFNSNNKSNHKTMSEKFNEVLENIKLSFSNALESLKPTEAVAEEVVIEEVVAEVVDTLDTGLQITIDTDESDVPKVGDKVTLTEDGQDAPNGVHLTESGSEVTVEEGLIVELKEVEEEEPIAEEEEPIAEEVPMEARFSALENDSLKFQESVTEFMTFSTEAFQATIATLKETLDSQELAFSEMKIEAEESKAAYVKLASSVTSVTPPNVVSEELPAVKSEGVVADYLANRGKRN